MTKYKWPLVLMAFLLWVSPGNTELKAAPGAVALDVGNTIKGNNADFYLDLPATWQKYMRVEREQLQPGVYELDKLNFYYQPIDSSYNEALLMSLFVYNKEDWYESLNYKKVFESEKYVFATYSTQYNPYSGSTSDKILFNRFIREAGDALFVKDFLSFPGFQTTQMNLNITVNGEMLEGKAIQLNMSTVLLPIRDVCAALGYSVGWLESEGTITVTSGSFYTAVSFNIHANTQYEMVNQNGQAYVSSMFFVERLRCSMSIDENSNVVITGKKS